MVEVSMIYEGDLSVRATHGPSGTELRTDAPKDNEGLGRSFSPTDLMATSVGSCMLTVLAIVARRRGVPVEGSRCRVEKHMATQPTRRIGRLVVHMEMPAGVSAEDRAALERAAMACPVKQSLHPEVQVDIHWSWLG